MSLAIFVALFQLTFCAPTQEQPTQQAPVAEDAAVEDVTEPTPATEVIDILKGANVFPKTNRVGNVSLTETDKAEGVVAAANVASSTPEGITVKVYTSSTERNQARLRMIKECPGCNTLTECGPILMYTPDPTARPVGQMSSEAREMLRERAQMQRQHHREYYDVLSKHFNCE